ncbi:AAA family ATPase [Nocardia mexicana]|uniref:AAA ATPase-like protein n=1 Tax=Nocardia mexicana TaxID=279262 RepID=A0A370HDS7_9NOCA|nr:AAA family ATPase [Nocardia mexicana]RDI55383.1 AAA ATPase-like protein [Nocardia mexicana]
MALIGREHVAGQLRDALRRTTSHGGLVLVSGEAGIGKTTLVTEVVGEFDAECALVLTATAWSGDGAPGFWPWVQVLRGLRRAATPDQWAALDAAAGNALSVLIGDTAAGEDGANLFRIGDAVTEALVAACARRPVIVVIDDLHRADPASVGVLAFVARHTWFERLTLVAALRDNEVAAPAHPLHDAITELRHTARSIDLTGLEVDEIGELAAAATGHRPPDAVVRMLHSLTGGNPFAAEEAARLWHAGTRFDEGPEESDGEYSGATSDPAVHHILDTRLALLPDSVVDLLTTAALLGGEFDSAVLAAVTAALAIPEPAATATPVLNLDAAGSADALPVSGRVGPGQVTSALASAVGARLIAPVGGNRYRFTHDLIREALAQRVDAAQARRRHAAIVAVLRSSDTAPGAVAQHAYLAADAVAADERIRLLLTAARDATGRLAAGEAAQHYRRAAALVRPGDARRRGDITLGLAHALTDAGELDDARHAFESLLDDAGYSGDPELYAQSVLGLNELGIANVEFDADREIERIERAHRLLLGEHSDAYPLGVRLRAAALRVGVHTGRSRSPEQAKRTAVESREVLRLARESGDDDALAASLLTRHDAIWRPGTAADRLTLANELVTVGNRLRREEVHLTGALLRCAALLELGDPRAHAELAAFTLRADRSRLPRFRFVALSRTGALALLTGRFDQARADIDGACTLAERLGEVDRWPLWLEQRWALAVQTGDIDGAAEFVDRYYTMAGSYTAVTDVVTSALRGDLERVRLRLGDVQHLYDEYPRHFHAGVLVAQAHAALALDEPGLRAMVRERLTSLRDYWAVVAGGGVVYGPYAYWLGRLAAAAGEQDCAAEDLRAAADSARRMRAWPWVEAAERQLRLLAHGNPASAAVAAEGPVPGNVFRRDGAVWTIEFAGRTVHLPDAKGLRDLHLLLSHPEHDIPSLELLGTPGDPALRAAGSLGAAPVLDAEAKASYHRRLTTLDAEIDRAVALGADDRAADLDRERAALLSELRGAAGLAGRTRRLGDDAERARKTVSARVRDSLRRLDREHPELAEHLRAAVSLGVLCRYHPHREVSWAL